jgi:GldM C-terminal domain
MRKVLFSLLFLFAFYISFGQIVSISTDRNNILYNDVDNPITIAAENYSCASLIVKIDNGKIDEKNGHYICKPKRIGKATITVYQNQNGKLKKIGKGEFRVKRLFDMPNIQTAIGPCINDCSVSAEVLAAQEFIRSDVVNTEFNARIPIDSFSVYIYSNCTCKIIHKKGNRITDDIKQEFHSLKANDIVVFRNIYGILQDGTIRELNPVMLFIKD